VRDGGSLLQVALALSVSHLSADAVVLAACAASRCQTHLHVFERLVHDLLGVLEVLEHVVEVGVDHAGKPVKQVRLQGGRRGGRKGGGARNKGGLTEARRRSERRGRRQQASEGGGCEACHDSVCRQAGKALNNGSSSSSSSNEGEWVSGGRHLSVAMVATSRRSKISSHWRT
jgi:hypothetical protein